MATSFTHLTHRSARMVAHLATAGFLFSAVPLAFASPNTSNPLLHPKDPHSFANINEVVMTHVHLKVKVDFKKKILDGYSELTLSPHETKKLVLDTKALKIKEIQRLSNGKWSKTSFRLGKADKILGRALTINILPDTEKVGIYYETTADSDGLNWATPEQTFDHDKPMLYSLSQSIYGRTWFPHQDTPAVRVTYSADVETPADMVAKMSADNDPSAKASAIHHFKMSQPVVPYLIALAVGDFKFNPLSDRSAVYAEKSISDKAAYEFADSEKMMQIIEKLYGKFPWHRNDMVVMPPSFPFGGMEHAQLTFLTPTVITGDRGLVSLNAHELAHSWSGNLVTNRYWRDLWLNEGFTTYVEKRVIEELYGKDWYELEQTLQYRGLQDEIADFDAQDEILAIDLKGQHPDDVFSEIPYAKGSLFLTTLEHVYGREIFDQFVRQYFKDFAWKTITTEEFEKYLSKNLIDKYPNKMTHAKVKEWIHQPGYPKDGFVPQSNALVALDQQIEQLKTGAIKANQLNTQDWTINHWVYFLKTLPTDLPKTTIADLDQTFGLTTSTNLIKEFNWLRYAIKAQYQPAIEQRLAQFLMEQGRIKLSKPLYQELVKTKQGKVLAKQLYQQAKAGLHPILWWEIEDNVFKKAGIKLKD